MNNYGYVKAATATPAIQLANPHYNKQQLMELTHSAVEQNIALVVFPELCLSGYTCGDLFFQQLLLDETLEAIHDLKLQTKTLPITIVFGAPLSIDGKLYNCAVVLHSGHILGIVPKTYLPNHNEFYEKRWFSSPADTHPQTIHFLGEDVPFGPQLIFRDTNEPLYSFTVEICEDLWSPLPPSTLSALCGAQIILNLSASNEVIGKSDYRKTLVQSHSAKTLSSYLYCSAGYGESTSDLVFSGHSLIFENGKLIAESNRYERQNNLTVGLLDLEKIAHERFCSSTFNDASKNSHHLFSELPTTIVHSAFSLATYKELPTVNRYPFVPSNPAKRQSHCQEILNIQSHGLAHRLEHIGHPKVLIGVSGGLDSTLALLVAVKTFRLLKRDLRDIIAVTMPGFGTSNRTYQNALTLINAYQLTFKEINITNSVTQHFQDINHPLDTHDTTYENAQARERTQILMDLANQQNGIVLGTGDLSELALGWATYNGDHMSMYGINASIPKTLVRYLVAYVADNETTAGVSAVLNDILDTPVSPELLPLDTAGQISQQTEKVLGPYVVHDFFLYYVLRHGFRPEKIFQLAINSFKNEYSDKQLLAWLKLFYRRFFSQQFKRNCLPDGPKVGTIALSPRGDWRMPSDAQANCWLTELDNLS